MSGQICIRKSFAEKNVFLQKNSSEPIFNELLNVFVPELCVVTPLFLHLMKEEASVFFFFFSTL